MPQADHFITDFLQYLQVQKRYSKHTITAYTTDLQAFEAFLKPYGFAHIADVKPAVVRTWLASLKDYGLDERSIVRKISALKSWFKFLLRNGHVQTSPMTAIATPRTKKRLPRFVEQDNLDTLFAHVAFPDAARGRQERLLLMVLYETGIRKSELIGLRRQNVDVTAGLIKVLGKGSKERIVPIGKSLAAELETWLAAGEGTYVFANEQGDPLNPRYVYSVVHEYLSLVTTADKKSPHVLRHSFATHLSNNGADLNAIKELLGHSSLAATQVYTHNDIKRLQEVFKKAHPRA